MSTNQRLHGLDFFACQHDVAGHYQSALILFSVLMFHWQIPAELKFLIVCAGTTLLNLVTYDLFVRNNALGVLLNGLRYPSGFPA